MTTSQRPSWLDLVCPDALSELRDVHHSDVESRENLKALLFRHNIPSTDSAGSKAYLRETLNLLSQDFLVRKQEVLRLDKKRKEKIEQIIQRYARSSLSLSELLDSRASTQENRGLHLFVLELSLFHLAQTMLVKRLMEAKAWEHDDENHRTLNWQLTQYLKKISPKGMLGRGDWGFLKQNSYSWFAPSDATMKEIWRLLNSVPPSEFSGAFIPQLMSGLSLEKELLPLGMNHWIPASKDLWQLLLDMRCQDQCIENAQQLGLSGGNYASVAIVGMRNGEALEGINSLFHHGELPTISCHSSNDLEQFFSEMSLLWNSLPIAPSLKISSLPKQKIRQQRTTRDLFSEPQQKKSSAQLAAYFPEVGAQSKEALHLCLDQMCENGLLLWASETFWPTETDQESELIREFALKNTVIRAIIDLRHLSLSTQSSLPCGVFLLEKSSSKEIRDSSRPQLLRLRGSVSEHEFPAVWGALRKILLEPASPGEIQTHLVKNIKIESMAAASSQSQLRQGPWTTLTEPSFFEIIGRLRSAANKAFMCASVMRWDSTKEMSFFPARGVMFREVSGKALVATPSSETNENTTHKNQFVFLPDHTVSENPTFFSAMINSGPVQFWYRLEHEQDCAAKNKRSLKRKTEQLLKLMPVTKVFSPGSLIPVASNRIGFKDLDSAFNSVASLIQKASFTLNEQIEIHQFVVTLENTILQQLKMVAQYFGHLFPKEPIERWRLPNILPDIDPLHAVTLFKHLNQAPLLQHPAMHPIRLKPVMDFRISNCEIKQLYGNLSELVVSDNHEPILKITGPSFLIKVSHAELVRRIGRPWLDAATKITLPLDIAVMTAQLNEFKNITENELNSLHKMIRMQDQLFASLLGLSQADADTIRKHLSPEPATTIRPAATKDSAPTNESISLELPKGLLQ